MKQQHLLTPDLRQALPALYSQEHVPDPLVRAKFFTPDASWTWYALEFDGEDLFFRRVECAAGLRQPPASLSAQPPQPPANGAERQRNGTTAQAQQTRGAR